jgi:hypothetical protein
MDKFFDIIKKLRPGVQSGKVSREQALAELMQESGVSEDIAGSAVTKMMPASGGITTLPEAEVLDVSFKPGVDKRGKRVEESPSQASGAKEKTSWKDYVEEETPSQGSGFANIDPDILSLGQKDRFEYEMAKYKQERSRKMQPFYKKYGAQSEKDKELIDELYEYNIEGEFVPSKGNPKYINNSARTFMQESVEDIPGVDEDLVLDILYSKESERFLKNQGVDNYINYVQTRFKEIGLNFNKPLLKRFLKDRYGPEEFSVGGRVGFFKGAVAGGGNISPGTDVKGNVRNDNPFTGGGGGGGNNNPPPVVKTPPPKTSVFDKVKAMGTVPLNLIGGLFGNPFDPTKPTQVINTKAQKDYLDYLANQKNEDTGVLSYDDYQTQFNLSDLKDPIAFSTAMTMGGTGFKKADTGDFTYSGGTYDFDGAVPFIDSGGLMGLAYRGGEYLGDKFNFSIGGRVGFKDGVGRKGILSALKDKLNEIAPGSTAVGKTTKAISDKAKRAAAERELTQDFNRFNKKFPAEEVKKERKILDVPAVPEGFSTSKETLLKQFPEIDEEFATTMMQMDKDLLGRTIMMLKDRRKDPELYDKLLEKYGDTLEFQGEFDKATRRKLNAEGGLNYLMGL